MSKENQFEDDSSRLNQICIGPLASAEIVDETISQIQKRVAWASSEDWWTPEGRSRMGYKPGLLDTLNTIKEALVEAKSYTEDMLAYAKSCGLGGVVGTTCSS